MATVNENVSMEREEKVQLEMLKSGKRKDGE